MLAPNLDQLTHSPRAIVDRRNKIVLLWSAKAGCTFAIKWIFRHMGLLQKALAYHPWVHRYRRDVFYATDDCKAAIADLCASPSSYRIVKVVRDPFRRAVSSYVHAVRHSHEYPDLLGYFSADQAKPTFTFREFVRYLATIDLEDSDIHYRVQTHPLERQFLPASMFLLHLEHSMESMPKLEMFLGLTQTDPQRYRDSPHHASPPASAEAEFTGDDQFQFPIVGNDAPIVPHYRSFYDRNLEESVYGLYIEDFLRYGYPTRVKDCAS